MAGKTTAELTQLIEELQRELTQLRVALSLVQQDIERAEMHELRDRITKIEALLSVLDAAAVLRKVATLEEPVAELKKWREERDRRNWQFWLGVGMVVFTLFVNLFVAPWKR
jgi:ribosomal protein L29